MRNILLTAATVDLEIMSQSPKEDSIRYSIIGAAVILVSVFASCSGTYALYSVIDNLYIALPFGLLWGSLIFTLDRMILAGLSGTNSSPGLIVSRFILALMIGMVMSKPLELYIFKNEINNKLNDLRLEDEALKRVGVDSIYDKKLIEIKNRISALERETSRAIIQAKTLDREYWDERNGISNGNTTGNPGNGIEARKKKEKYNLAFSEYQNINNSNSAIIQNLRQEETSIIKDRQNKTSIALSSHENFGGLLKQLEALQKLPNQAAILFITLLFITMECVVIIAKTMGGKGIYDQMIQDRKQAFKAESLRKMNLLHHEINSDILITQEIDNEKMKQEITKNEELLKHISLRSVGLAKEQVDNWYYTELEKNKKSKRSKLSKKQDEINALKEKINQLESTTVVLTSSNAKKIEQIKLLKKELENQILLDKNEITI